MLGTIPLADVLDMLSVDTDYDDTDDDQHVRDVLPHKRRSDHYPKLLEDIRTHGMELPIMIRSFHGTPWLTDGHHRVAAAVDLGLTRLVWSDLPLDVCDEPFNPVMRGDWGPYRPDARATTPV